MEFINPIQLVILVVIIALLIAQKVAINRGMLVEAHYSANQRLSIAIFIAVIPSVWGIVTNQYFIVVLGVVIGVICYQIKSWYKLK
ncbi:MAG: hypothetical protein ABJH28_13975 [Paraglaciecola sp.]|uniref:hypothetical protein n=1 Tax=Paraglaciecola sp. TaxID=1920173 RepID=UPI003264C8B5